MTAKPTTTPRVKLIRATAPDYFRFDFATEDDDDQELVETLRKAGMLSVPGELDQATVRELLDYNPVTGDLRWRCRDRKWFKSDRAWKIWNTRYSGKLVGSNDGGDYRETCIFGRGYKVHRLIWLYVTGVWPAEIDHINRKPWDNRLINLREVTRQQNTHNQSLRRSNTSGRVGVNWVSHRGKWKARIDVNSRSHFLGLFETFENAVAARAAAERLYGFSPGHGARPQYQRVLLRRRPDHTQPTAACPA